MYKSSKHGNLQMQEYIKVPQASSKGRFEMSSRAVDSHDTPLNSDQHKNDPVGPVASLRSTQIPESVK